MASETPVSVVIAKFPEPEGAKRALSHLNTANKEGRIHLQDAAVLTKGMDSKLHVSDSADKGMHGRGALIGGVAGATVGVLAGPVGWAALGGAAIGGLAHKLRDQGIPDDDLRRMGESVKPGGAAIVAVVDEDCFTEVRSALSDLGGEVAAKNVSGEVAKTLDDEAFKAQSGTA